MDFGTISSLGMLRCMCNISTYFIYHRHACVARVTVVVLYVSMSPGPSSGTQATKRPTRHTGDLSIVLAPE